MQHAKMIIVSDKTFETIAGYSQTHNGEEDLLLTIVELEFNLQATISRRIQLDQGVYHQC